MVYPNERDVFYREHDDRAYGVEAFVLQYTAMEIPFEIIASLLFAVLYDLAVGLPRTPEMFFLTAYTAFCLVNTSESLGIMFNTLFNHSGFSVNVTSLFLTVAQVMSGIISIDIPAFLEAFNKLNPVHWAIGPMAVYIFRDQNFTCEDFQQLPDGQCPVQSGEQVLKLYSLETDTTSYMAALGACVIIYRLIAYILVKMKREGLPFLARKK